MPDPLLRIQSGRAFVAQTREVDAAELRRIRAAWERRLRAENAARDREADPDAPR